VDVLRVANVPRYSCQKLNRDCARLPACGLKKEVRVFSPGCVSEIPQIRQILRVSDPAGWAALPLDGTPSRVASGPAALADHTLTRSRHTEWLKKHGLKCIQGE
jgi:hypothetical protein